MKAVSKKQVETTDKPKPVMKSFIKRNAAAPPIKQKAESSDDDDGAPSNPNGDFDFGGYEEEIVPISAKPFLFGAIDK